MNIIKYRLSPDAGRYYIHFEAHGELGELSIALKKISESLHELDVRNSDNNKQYFPKSADEGRPVGKRPNF